MNALARVTVVAVLLSMPALAAGQSRNDDAPQVTSATALFAETGVAGDASRTGVWLGGFFL